MTKIKGAHPLAGLFPMMSKPELEALADDIKANGLREPISVTEDGLIVDGRNRYEACNIAGVEPSYETVDGEASNLIVSANIFRRHMTQGQIAILAVVAELGIELPENDKPPGGQPDEAPRASYDYRKQAHKRVERLVSSSLIRHAAEIVRWAPDHARVILETGQGWREGREVAVERSKEANNEEQRTATLREEMPELLAQVSEDGLTLAEAWRLRDSRIRQERDTRTRLTGYLISEVTPLLKKSESGIRELVEHYDPELTSRPIGIAELDEAITYLQAVRSEMKRQKKG